MTPDTFLQDCRRLVECESPSNSAVDLGECLALVTAMVEERLTPARTSTSPSGLHRHWQWGPHPRVVLVTHYDTVWPVGSLTDHPFRVDGNVLRGCGSFDMKVGLVMALHLLDRLQRHAGRQALEAFSLVAVGDEEVGSPDSRPFMEGLARSMAGAMVFEGCGPQGSFKTARKGTASYTFVSRGRAAHAGLDPERGSNAMLPLSNLALRCEGLSNGATGLTVTPTTLHVGTSRNTVPDRGELQVDVRGWHPEELEQVDARLCEMAGRSSDGDVEVELLGGLNRPPMSDQSSTWLFDELAAAWHEVSDQDVPTFHVGGASDANFIASLGVPTLDGLGAVGGGAHATDEHVQLSETLARLDVLDRLLVSVARRPWPPSREGAAHASP